VSLTESDTRAKLIDPAIHARGWTVSRQEIEAKNYDPKAVNPNAKSGEDTRTPEELLDFIEVKGKEVAEVLKNLRAIK
jgi:type I restriction enzyme M protein